MVGLITTKQIKAINDAMSFLAQLGDKPNAVLTYNNMCIHITNMMKARVDNKIIEHFRAIVLPFTY